MNTNRLSETIQTQLNLQATKEAEAAQIYLAYGCWADSQGYGGVSNFLLRHASEERNHMTKVLRYIMDRGGEVTISAIKAPPQNPQNIQDCFEKTFQHEVDNSNAIYDLVNLAHEERDWATYNFGQAFVKEQIEEEKVVMDLLDKLKIAGGPNATDDSLFNLDKYLAKAPDHAALPREATEDEPG